MLVITSENAQTIDFAQWGFNGKAVNPKTKNLTEKLFIKARGATIDAKRNLKGPWQAFKRWLF